MLKSLRKIFIDNPENVTNRLLNVKYQDLSNDQYDTLCVASDVTTNIKAQWEMGLAQHHSQVKSYTFTLNSKRSEGYYLLEKQYRASFFFARITKSLSLSKDDLLYKGHAHFQMGLYRFQFGNHYTGLLALEVDRSFIHAVQDFETAYRLFKEENKVFAAQALYMHASCTFLGGHGIRKDLANALNSFSKAFGLSDGLDNNTAALAQYMMGQCYYENNQRGEAIASFRKAADLFEGNNDNDFADANLMLGKCYYQNNNIDAARESFKLAAEYQCTDDADQDYAGKFYKKLSAPPVTMASILDSFTALLTTEPPQAQYARLSQNEIELIETEKKTL